MFDAVIEFPKFKLGVRTRGEHVVEIRYLPASALPVKAKNAVAEEAARQLERYRDDPDATFTFPVKIEGTPLEPTIAEFLDEVRTRGLRITPQCYLTTEWGVPFGTVVIGIPWLLLVTR